MLLERGVGMLPSPGDGGESGGGGDGGGGGDDDVGGGGGGAVQSASIYLLAKCCSDLRLHSEAEDVLLRPCRDVYHRTGGSAATATATATTTRSGNADGGSGSGSGSGSSPDDEFDDWLLTTSPCPIPNGAAGLALLGLVCRRSDRPARAAKYYRMSLKVSTVDFFFLGI